MRLIRHIFIRMKGLPKHVTNKANMHEEAYQSMRLIRQACIMRVLIMRM